MNKSGEQKKFNEELLWNYISIIIMSLSGMLFNILIVCFYDSETLGIFNQVYAYYIVSSQICTWGIHMSIMRQASLGKDIKEQRVILSSAMVLVICISILVCLIIKIYLFKNSDSNLRNAFGYVLPALMLFAVNKVILGFFNGRSFMKLYAILQSFRNISIAAGILFLSLQNVNNTEISKCFFIGEGIVVILSFIFLIKYRMLTIRVSWSIIKEHFSFGSKILLSNLVLELNTKVDVICLGWILKDDYLIGIYSFAVLFAEGFYQIFVVVRRNINPIIAQRYQIENKREKELNDLSDMISHYVKRLKWLAYIFLLFGYMGVCLVLGKREYFAGLGVLAIICFFITLTAKSIIMGNFYAQIGKPEKESFINVCTVVSNMVANVLLIYFMGIYGAAVATGISYLIFAFLLSYQVKKTESIQI